MKHTRTILIKTVFITLMLFSFASCKCPVDAENVVIEPKAKASINIINAVSYGSTYKVEAWNRTLISELKYTDGKDDYVSIGAGACDLSFTPEDDSLFAVKYPLNTVEGEAYTMILSGYRTPTQSVFVRDKIEDYNPQKSYVRFINAVNGYWYNNNDTEFKVDIEFLMFEILRFADYTEFKEISVTDYTVSFKHPYWEGVLSWKPEAGKLYTFLIIGDSHTKSYGFREIITDRI